MKKTVWTLLLAIIILIGCSTAKQIQTYTPEGQLVYYISCSDYSLGDCYIKAGEICGAKGYNIFNLPRDNSNSLVIKCKP